MTTIINVSAGAREYVEGTITELRGKDISADTFEVALGLGTEAPTTGWKTPDAILAGTTTASKVVKILVTNAFLPGIYSAWVRVTDGPEVVPRLIQSKITLK